MTASLTVEWFDRFASAVTGVTGSPPLTARLTETVTGAAEGDLRWTITFADGKVVAVDAEDPSAKIPEEGGPDVAFTVPDEVAVAIERGELEADVAYMRGDLKATGATGPLLDYFVFCRSDGFRNARAEAAAVIDG